VRLLAAACAVCALAAPAHAPNRFDGTAAFAFLQRQVALGPRPSGSAAGRRLAAILRASVPNGRYQLAHGMRNVVGTIQGRDRRRTVVLGAHYDTLAMPHFVGANDGASGTAILVQLARTIRPRTLRPTLVLAFFDGEEAPPGTSFAQNGMRGSGAAAPQFAKAEAMILLDMVGDRDLSIPRETNSDPRLWAKIRAAARRAGTAWAFPGTTQQPILDDHIPFLTAGVPAVDVIDFTFPCWHTTCDDARAVSPRSLDAVGETMIELLRRL
jgi:Zn-dependent M28 family amino/carboxypeptidase